MTLLFTQAWDILPDKEDEYTAFVAQQFIPKCLELGLTPVGGYYVETGIGPRVISVKRVASLQDLAGALSNPAFRELINELKELVSGYRTKILQPTGRTKNRPYEIQKGVWKYNQYYDLRPGMRKKYGDFIMQTYLPLLDKLPYLEVTGGWNVLIGGFSEIIGELTFKDPGDIACMLDNGEFRELTHILRRDYVNNYSSRILRTTERFDEPRWFVL